MIIHMTDILKYEDEWEFNDLSEFLETFGLMRAFLNQNNLKSWEDYDRDLSDYEIIEDFLLRMDGFLPYEDCYKITKYSFKGMPEPITKALKTYLAQKKVEEAL